MVSNLPSLSAALALHQQGHLGQAEAMYREILRSEPQHFDALQLLAMIAAQRSDSAAAVELFDQALKINPRHAGALVNRGIALHGLKHPAAALESFDRALEISPDLPEALNNRGIALASLNRTAAALESYDRALRIRPEYPEALNNRGEALRILKRFGEALASFDRALTVRPEYAEAFNNRGIVLRELARLDEALESFDRALGIRPGYADALSNRGSALRALGRLEDALASCDRALEVTPDDAAALITRGNALADLRRLDEALASFDRALEIHPHNAEALNNRGVVLRNLTRLEESLESFDRALGIRPDDVQALYNRSGTLLELKRSAEALESCQRALRIAPDDAGALLNCGNALRDLNRLDEALECYARALEVEPGHEFLYGSWLNSRMQVCDWADLDTAVSTLVDRISSGDNASHPFHFLAVSESPALEQKAAQIWVRSKYPPGPVPTAFRARSHARVRVGYFSADFRSHPVSTLMAELLETHDRSRFEITAFSYGPDTGDPMRKRIEAAVERFMDVRIVPDKDVVALARSLEIDIAVDLGGFTNSRTGLFALRAAPLQVNFLGYPGTMGADYIDYLIADAVIVPEGSRRYYSEKIAYIPSYQPNDSKRAVAEREFTREEFDLPRTGFVFCCFNNHYKITPSVFTGWMRILGRVEGSVLWLSDGSERAKSNLRKEAALRGIAAERLIFAKRMPSSAEHLARHRLAGLFIDTFPYNAHTTASDALWAGLPVLTCTGATFASRVGASVLNAIGLPELVTETREDYEALAVELASRPERLEPIRRKLCDNLHSTPLFDTKRHVGHLEAAYMRMCERYRAGLPPEHILLEP